MASIIRLCHWVMWLDGGRIVRTGTPSEVIAEYMATVAAAEPEVHVSQTDRPAFFRAMRVCNVHGETVQRVLFSQPIVIELVYEIREPLRGCVAALRVRNRESLTVFCSTERDSSGGDGSQREPGIYRSRCYIPPGWLMPGPYFVTVSLIREGIGFLDRHENVMRFDVLPDDSPTLDGRDGVVAPVLRWEVEQEVPA